MSDLSSGVMELLQKLGLPSNVPVAESRITHSPIYLDPALLGRGMSGMSDAQGIHLAPSYLAGINTQIPHESAHQILAQSPEALAQASTFAQQVPSYQLQSLAAIPLYQQMGAYSGSPTQKMDEGLAMSIGDPDATKYVMSVARSLKDPRLRDQLLRLHMNEIANRKSSARSDFY